jgi:hypothetical protein
MNRTEGKDFFSQFKMFIAFKLASSRYAQNIANLGVIADYILFIKRNFGEGIEKSFSRKREGSWGKIVKTLNKSERILFLEFGVAWGYATKTMLDLFKENGFSVGSKNSDNNVTHLGFDLFSGLPKFFRQYPEGYFATSDGTPPHISGANFVKGLVQETLVPEIQKLNPKDYDRVVIFFDLDLYEPTKFAMEALEGFVRPGTFIYFDELFDFEERRVLLESFDDFNKFELFSFTPTSGTIVIK